MRVYLVGSHSTGKTTLCRYISGAYKLRMITEMARSVLSEWELPLESLRTDVALVGKFQQAIMERQMEAEYRLQDGFVSDRALDGLAYAAEHTIGVLPAILHSKVFKKYVDWVRGGTVFFIRPHKTLLKEDGVRETPTWDSVLRIDGMVKLLLEQYEIDYLPISTVSMQERVRTVKFILDRLV